MQADIKQLSEENAYLKNLNRDQDKTESFSSRWMRF